MRTFLGLLAIALGVGGLGGCSDKNYAPFTDTLYINAEITGRKSIASAEPSDGSGYVSVCMWDTTELEVGSECGLRTPNVTQDQIYDHYTIEGDNIETTVLYCHIAEQTYYGHEMVSGDCKAYLPAAEPGWSFDVVINDETFATVTMPKRPDITSPADQSTFSVSAGKDLVMTWPASGLTDSMSWHLWPADLGSGNPCYEKTVWNKSATGPLTDTGSFTLPSDALPSQLPPEGCAGVLELTVEHKGPTSRGASMGATIARETSFTLVTFMP